MQRRQTPDVQPLAGLNDMVQRLVIIGVGGASCSGKTLLAKHLRRVLPKGAVIVHQDDFAPPSEQVPYSPKYPEWQDWDDPPTCVDWELLRTTLKHIRQTGCVPTTYESNDHLNKQVEVSVDDDRFNHWRAAFESFENGRRQAGEELVWVIVDGFVLFWDEVVTDALDVRLLLRVPEALLRRRREERQTYVLSNPKDAAEGGVWVDPPGYFPKIVYPAYMKAHQHIFEAGDVESGAVAPAWRERLTVISPADGPRGMSAAFDEACRTILEKVRKGAGSIFAENSGER